MNLRKAVSATAMLGLSIAGFFGESQAMASSRDDKSCKPEQEWPVLVKKLTAYTLTLDSSSNRNEQSPYSDPSPDRVKLVKRAIQRRARLDSIPGNAGGTSPPKNVKPLASGYPRNTPRKPAFGGESAYLLHYDNSPGYGVAPYPGVPYLGREGRQNDPSQNNWKSIPNHGLGLVPQLLHYDYQPMPSMQRSTPPPYRAPPLNQNGLGNNKRFPPGVGEPSQLFQVVPSKSNNDGRGWYTPKPEIPPKHWNSGNLLHYDRDPSWQQNGFGIGQRLNNGRPIVPANPAIQPGEPGPKDN